MFLQEKEKYLSVLEHYQKKYAFRLYAYTILDNHAHLLIEISETPLSKIMQGVQQIYTVYYNKKYDRVGHVFQQRYKANLCDKDGYLLALIKYIHQNPLRAGLIEGLAYEWSSHRYYLNPEGRGLVDVRFPLSLFHQEQPAAVRLYQEFMGERSELNQERTAPVVYYLTALADGVRPREEKPLPAPVSLEQVLALVAAETGLTENMIRSGLKTGTVVKARKLFTYLASRHSQARHTEIAQFLGISASAVTRILAGCSEQAPEISNLHHLEKELARSGHCKTVNQLSKA